MALIQFTVLKDQDKKKVLVNPIPIRYHRPLRTSLVHQRPRSKGKERKGKERKKTATFEIKKKEPISLYIEGCIAPGVPGMGTGTGLGIPTT